EGALEVLVTGAVWYYFAALFTVVFALPLFLLMKRMNAVRWWVSVGAGLLIGAIGAFTSNGQTNFFYAKVVMLGGLAGFAFWFVERSEMETERGRSSGMPPNKQLQRTGHE